MAYYTVSFNDYMPTMWTKLLETIGNEAGVAALMGNMYAESGCTPYACQPSRPYSTCMTYIGKVDRHEIDEYSFVHKGCSANGGVASGQGGFGLAQWTYYTRKQNLYDEWENYGGSIGSLEFELYFTKWELEGDYSGTLSALQSADINNLLQASNFVLFNYEGPADKSAEVQDTRYWYAYQIYQHFAGTAPVPVPDPQPPPDPPKPNPSPPLIDVGGENRKMPIWMYPILRQ